MNQECPHCHRLQSRNRTALVTISVRCRKGHMVRIGIAPPKCAHPKWGKVTLCDCKL